MIFSIVIPTRNRPHELARCLSQLAPGVQLLAADKYGVIVSDDSADGGAKGVTDAFPWVHYTAGPKGGPAANRNHGAAQACGSWLVFTDDDCVPDPNWLQGFYSKIQQQSAVKVWEGRVYADRERRSCYETAPLNESGGYLWSCNFAIDRAVFERAGGFDERFRHAAMEDVELRLRLDQARVPIGFCPEAAVMHPWRAERNIRRARAIHRESVLLFNSLHPGRAVQRGTRWRTLFRRVARDVWGDLGRFGWKAIAYHWTASWCDIADIRKYPSGPR